MPARVTNVHSCLAYYVRDTVNTSVLSGIFPTCLKRVIATPWLNKVILTLLLTKTTDQSQIYSFWERYLKRLHTEYVSVSVF